MLVPHGKSFCNTPVQSFKTFVTFYVYSVLQIMGEILAISNGILWKVKQMARYPSFPRPLPKFTQWSHLWLFKAADSKRLEKKFQYSTCGGHFIGSFYFTPIYSCTEPHGWGHPISSYKNPHFLGTVTRCSPTRVLQWTYRASASIHELILHHFPIDSWASQTSKFLQMLLLICYTHATF